MKKLGLDLCTTYNVDPVEFVEQWMAFSLSHLNGAEPTLDYLNDLERKELANKKALKSAKNDRFNVQRDADIKQLRIYGSDMDRIENVGDVMDSYLCNTPKVSANIFYKCLSENFMSEYLSCFLMFFAIGLGCRYKSS